MSDDQLATCPVTKIDVKCQSLQRFGRLYAEVYLHDPAKIAIATEVDAALKKTDSLTFHDNTFTRDQVDAGLLLLKSKLWRIKEFGGKSIFLAYRHHLVKMENDDSVRNLSSEYSFYSIEDVIEESKRITFIEKCLNTLENLYDFWKRYGKLPSIPYFYEDSIEYKHRVNLNKEMNETDEVGLTYTCDVKTAAVVYKMLQDEGYLSSELGRAIQHPLALTPKGVIEAEKIKSGREVTLKRGFFIRQYDLKKDESFRPILDEVRSETGCDINAVWEKEKNEKLDELILRRIRESSVIILDVTGERFNVGLEAGYAMALGKQIIVIRDEEEKGHELPFDIRTMNCFFYKMNEPDKLKQKLIDRVLDALEEAKHGTRKVW